MEVMLSSFAYYEYLNINLLYIWNSSLITFQNLCDYIHSAPFSTSQLSIYPIRICELYFPPGFGSTISSLIFSLHLYMRIIPHIYIIYIIIRQPPTYTLIHFYVLVWKSFSLILIKNIHSLVKLEIINVMSSLYIIGKQDTFIKVI